MFMWLTQNLFWTQAQPILFVLIGLFLLHIFIRPLLYIAAFIFVFSLFFFRNPDRVCPEALRDPLVIMAPADGKIVDIVDLDDELFGQKIAIFLSPLDVHVQWSPVPSTVQEVTYHEGAFEMAFLPKSSELNERNDVLLKTDSGTFIKVRQIAGTIARTIVCWVRAGDKMEVGQKFGMIKFGSRVELFLPRSAQLSVEVGQRVSGGLTVLGRL